MECAYHPGREPVAGCASCGKLICEECRVTLGGKSYCRQCVEAMVAEKAAAPAEVPAKVRGVSFWQSISAIPAILKYASYTAAGCGLIYTILSAIHEGDIWGGMDGAGVAVAGQVFWGLLWTVFSGAFLYGLSHLASKLLKEKESEP